MTVKAQGNFVNNIRFPELEVVIPEVKKELLDEQVNLYYIPNDYFPVMTLEIHFYGGRSVLKERTEIPQLLASVLKYGGTTGHPREKFLQELSRNGADISIRSEYDKVIFSLTWLKDDNTAPRLFRELLTGPAFDAAEFKNAKRKMVEGIKNRNERTESIVFRKAGELLFRNYSKGVSPQPESIEKINIGDLKKYFSYLVKNAPMAVVAYGDVEPSSLKKFWKTLGLGTASHKNYVPEKISFDELRARVPGSYYIKKNVNQSMVLFTGYLPPHNHPDFYSIQVLNYIIGGGGFNSYFMKQIRSDRGLAYSAITYPSFSDSYGVLYCYALTRNDATAEVEKLMGQILSEKTFRSIRQRELDDAVEAINNKFVFLFRKDEGIIHDRLRFDEDGMPEDYLVKYRENMKKVTLADLVRVGKKYYLSGNLNRIMLGPAGRKGYKTILPEDTF